MSKLSDNDIKKLIDNNLVIIIDTREKNNHIAEAFDKFNIKYIRQKVQYGDYSAMLTKCEEYNILEDTILNVSVERKNSLDEIGSNLTRGKNRFAKEMQRCIDDNGAMIIMIENSSYEMIVNKQYKVNITPKQFLALLHSLYAKYRVPFIFINAVESPLFVYNILKYYAREYIKNNSLTN